MYLTFKQNLDWVPLIYEGCYSNKSLVLRYKEERNYLGQPSYGFLVREFMDYGIITNNKFQHSIANDHNDIYYLISAGFLGTILSLNDKNYLSTLAVLMVNKERFSDIKLRIINSLVVNNLDVKLVINKSFLSHIDLYKYFKEVFIRQCEEKEIKIEMVDNFDFIYEQPLIDNSSIELVKSSVNKAGIETVQKVIAHYDRTGQEDPLDF